MTREEAMVIIRNHVRQLREEGCVVLATAIEYVLFKVPRDDSMAHFPVVGAGELEVGRDISQTGQAVGVHLGVSWGSWGYAGGVMDARDVRNLAEHLLGVVGDRPTRLLTIEK